MHHKINLCPASFLCTSREPGANVCLYTGYAKCSLDLRNVLKAYPFKGVSLPGIVGCGCEGVGPIMLVAEGVLPDAEIVKEGIVVYQLIK